MDADVDGQGGGTSADPNEVAATEYLRARSLIERGELIEALAPLSSAASTAAMGADPAAFGEILITRAAVLTQLSRNVDDLEEAVAVLRSAVGLLRCSIPGLQIRARTMLGFAYLNRPSGLRWKNLEKALSAFRSSAHLAVRSGRPVLWAEATRGLATVYIDRRVGNPATNRRRAIELFLSASEELVRHADSRNEWAQCQYGLAQAYLDDRVELSASDIDGAILACRAALQVIRQRSWPTAWAQLQMVLGKALVLRATDVLGADFRRGLEAMHEACRVLTGRGSDEVVAAAWHDLGVAYSRRFEAGRTRDGELADACIQRALQIWTPQAHPVEYRDAALSLGLLRAEGFGDWAGAAEAWQRGLDAHELLLTMADDRRRQALEAPQGGRIVGLLAYALARLDRPADAAVVLEHGRGRIVRDLLQSRELASRRDDPDLQAAAHKVYSALPTNSGGGDEFGAALTRLRTVDPNFMRPTDFNDLAACVEANQAVVFSAVTPVGSVWVILSRRGAKTAVTAEAIVLDRPKFEDLRLLLIGEEGRGGYAFGPVQEPDRFPEILDETLRLLHPLVAPLVERLTGLGLSNLVLVPTGYAILLPLHAVLTGNLIVSYSPSLLALRQTRGNLVSQAAEGAGSGRRGGRRHGRHSNRRQRSAPAPPRPRELALVAVAVGDGDPPLPFADAEVRRAATHFPRSTVFAGNATTESEVLAAAATATHLHFASHGHADLAQPLASFVELPGGNALRVTDLFRHTGRIDGTRLVVLSACQSAITYRLPDELLALPFGFLAAGAGGVIATMWPVDDLSAAILTDRLYTRLFRDGLAPAQALRLAQLDVRSMSTADALAYVRDLSSTPTTGLPEQGAARGLAGQPLRPVGQAAPFAHPYFWAGFVHLGV